jgi:hypothetical protein
VRFLREADDDGRQAAVLEVFSDESEEKAEIWIDRESGDFYKLVYEGVALAGQPPRVEERYSDFRQVDGIRIPHKVAIHQNGPLLTDVTILEAAVNTGADATQLAEKP